MSRETQMIRRTKSGSDMTRLAPWSPRHGAGTSTSTNNQSYVQSPPRQVLLGLSVDVAVAKAPCMQDLEAGVSEIIEITEIMPAKLDADMRSLAAASPPRGASTNKIHYYMHNPLPGGGYKSSSMQATPIESPSHPSFDRHSRSSFGSRHFGNRKAVNTKGWPECNIIQEEGSDEGLYGRKSSLSLLWKIMMWFISFCLVLAIIGLVIWGAERPNMPDVVVKTIAINDFYASEGTHHSGVPTKMVTLNCSLSMVVHNPASMFGIHVTSGPILLMYSDIVVGVGKVHKYYQPKDSHRHVSVVIHGHKVLLYGAGDGLDLSRNDGSVPLTLDFVLISRGYIISELVRVTHNVHVTCKITVDAKATRPIRFPKDACAIYKA